MAKKERVSVGHRLNGIGALVSGVTGLLLVMATPLHGQVPVAVDAVSFPPATTESIPGQYIVKLNQGVARDGFINEHGAATFHRYTVINGFAARMSEAAAERLAADDRVESVSADVVVRAFGKPTEKPGGGGGGKKGGGDSGGGGECTVSDVDMPSPEVLPTGVSRVGADLATATGAGVKVAVIDTGIDPCHPDLRANYKGGKNLLVKGKGEPRDDHGHGTHVAGIIGAAANGVGVVGVAPEVELYAVKVLAADGSGSLSTVIKGIDWAVNNGMDAVNLSLGALDLTVGSGPMCNAVANAAAAGVTVVAAAGNAADEALFYTPANCRESLTVSAFVDTNGLGGEANGAFVFNIGTENDETFADLFSNYSDFCWDLDGDGLCTDADTMVVNLMAPGTVIYSTMPTYAVALNDEGVALDYDTLTGTSMAAPHVAGTVALYLSANPGATPGQIREALTLAGECYSPDGEVRTVGDDGLCPIPWPDDVDVAPEPLLDACGALVCDSQGI